MDFCHDQNGSRFIQQRLEVAGSAEKEAIMEEILTDLPALCIDVLATMSFKSSSRSAHPI